MRDRAGYALIFALCKPALVLGALASVAVTCAAIVLAAECHDALEVL